MDTLSLKNWGRLADFGMMYLLLLFIFAAGNSTTLTNNDNGPLAIFVGLQSLNFSNFVFIEAGLGLIVFGQLQYNSYMTGRAGALCFYSKSGQLVKEAQPFSRYRGYGLWQRFYYATFWIGLLALVYNLILAVYSLAPGHIPLDMLTAWGYAASHSHQLVAEMLKVGFKTYVLAFVTWFIRAYIKKYLDAWGLLTIRHWYAETETEAELAAIISERAAEQNRIVNACFLYGPM